ncbi:TolC family protein [Magnetococcus sp. PR-3]|uniref:TolC family protein n=1 Tax=Magnetococcus sp. PR-3 TaxID=3120355 RepID=UPI002FCE4FC8
MMFKKFIFGVVFSVTLLSHAMADTIKLDLPTLIKQARQHGNPQVAMVQARAQQAAAEKAAVEAEDRARLDLQAHTKRYKSHAEGARQHDYQTILEVNQPLHLFGHQQARERAADLRYQAKRAQVEQAQSHFVVDVIERFYQLHASELAVQSLEEAHALAYVRWDRAKEHLALGKTDDLSVAQWLARVERTRHKLYQARSENRMARVQLSLLTGQSLSDTLIRPPAAPKGFTTEYDVEPLLQRVLSHNPQAKQVQRALEAARAEQEATVWTPELNLFSHVGQSARELSGRNRWAIGLELDLPLWSGGALDAKKQKQAATTTEVLAKQDATRRTLTIALKQLLSDLSNAKQGLIAAKATMQWAEANLMKRQSLYQMERVSTLGDAMVELTQAEADQVRADGAYYVAVAKLASLLGDNPEQALQADYLQQIGQRDGQNSEPQEGGFTPPVGSGYGEHHVKE